MDLQARAQFEFHYKKSLLVWFALSAIMLTVFGCLFFFIDSTHNGDSWLVRPVLLWVTSAYFIFIFIKKSLRDEPAIILTDKGFLWNRPNGLKKSIEWDQVKILRFSNNRVLVKKKFPIESGLKGFLRIVGYYLEPSFIISFFFMKEDNIEFLKAVQGGNFLNSDRIENHLL